METTNNEEMADPIPPPEAGSGDKRTSGVAFGGDHSGEGQGGAGSAGQADTEEPSAKRAKVEQGTHHGNT